VAWEWFETDGLVPSADGVQRSAVDKTAACTVRPPSDDNTGWTD